jgi:hypothetical protein
MTENSTDRVENQIAYCESTSDDKITQDSMNNAAIR